MKLFTLQKGLVGHWKLSEESFNPTTNRFTESALQNHGIGNGTQLGGSPTFQADHMGQLLQASPFNGTDDYIDCGNDSSLELVNFTISAWIKKDAVISLYNFIVRHMNTGSGTSGYGLLISNNNIELWLGSSASFFGRIIVLNQVVENNWHHIVGTWDGTTAKIYNNNVEVKSEIPVGTINDWTGNLVMGSDYDATFFFDGTIDEVRLYNRALSADEITLLYKSYHPGVRI